MKKISVAIATFNEEENIEKCLKSVVFWTNEIVVVDGSSTDKTVDVAKKYKAKVIVSDNPPIFHINKQKALEECTSEWILQLDADEVIADKLKNEIINVVNQSSTINGYYIPRKNLLLGRWMKKGGLYPDYVIRLFKRGKGRFPAKDVHEQIDVDGKVGYLKNDLLHYAYSSFAGYLKKANTYTLLTAEKFDHDKLPISVFTTIKYVIVVPTKTFLTIYFRHLGFVDGFPGFVWAFFSALHYPIAYIKYWEKSRHQ
jgi:glycosyltransferase involved in cell wall biosynthesis